MAKEDDVPDVISIKKYERAEVKQIVAEMKAYEELTDKVRNYVIWHKQRGGLPTLRAISHDFGITLDDAENIAISEDDMNLVVGVRMGIGFYEFKTQGEYQIDLVEDDTTSDIVTSGEVQLEN